ncbi:ABC transporter ATP-binding protein [Kitasatospora paracochleata]|uniref:ABC-type lipoprotein export system ATPase subunit n=1 Tax=Kitasatospora paracochleata TaxID=58354 RepID=A0ABT1IXU7_9ACTN|nr:ABC transporter ATP-binding protein [Kitasatospora paracochleata]MCP2309969.1 ABC-type lipoprotein export system ATPase subunit [Kitasatospora paracochleata]
MTAVLVAEDVHKGVQLASGRRLDLVRAVNLTVAAGESVAVVGRSGSGKSTLLTVLGLLSRPDRGRITVAGRDTATLGDRPLSALRNGAIGFVFQNYSLLAHLDAAENVALPLNHGPRVPGREVRARTADALAAVGLAERARSRPRQLSGGEQQRVAIARALVRDPSLVLADEPTGALDTATADRVLATLTGVTARRGAALVVVTHDREVAMRMDRVLRLEDGVLVEERQPAAPAVGERRSACV